MKQSTYTARTVTGATQHNAMILITPPHLPRLNRSRGIGLPKYRRQMTQAMVMVYEDVKDTMTKDIIALKPTTGPKLTHARTHVNPIVVQTALRGTSASWTCVIYLSAICDSLDTR